MRAVPDNKELTRKTRTVDGLGASAFWEILEYSLSPRGVSGTTCFHKSLLTNKFHPF
jgi:hypothetical protein